MVLILKYAKQHIPYKMHHLSSMSFVFLAKSFKYQLSWYCRIDPQICRITYSTSTTIIAFLAAGATRS